MIRQILGLRMSDQDKIKQGVEFFRPSFHIFGNVLYFNVRRAYFNVRSKEFIGGIRYESGIWL